jgi:hypothetical protein
MAEIREVVLVDFVRTPFGRVAFLESLETAVP